MDLLHDRLAQLLVAALLVTAALALLVRAAPRGRGRLIRVVGVGGAGTSALEALLRAGVRQLDSVVIDTDVAAVRRSGAARKLAIGKATGGFGAGGDPAVGEAAAREAGQEIARALAGSELVVVVAGLGGGTGSGGAPIVAQIAREQGALTVAVVTKPFAFEGARRRNVADTAALALGVADAVATVPNDRARDVAPADVTVEQAFRTIDGIVWRSVAEIVGLFAVPGRISLDFGHVRSVLQGSGRAVVGLGRAGGDDRAAEATRRAIEATLLGSGLHGASSILLNVAASRTLRLAEIDTITEGVRAAADPGADVVFGMALDRRLRDQLQVSLIASGFGGDGIGMSTADLESSASDPGATGWRPVWLRDRSEQTRHALPPTPKLVGVPESVPAQLPGSEPIEAPVRRRRTARTRGSLAT